MKRTITLLIVLLTLQAAMSQEAPPAGLKITRNTFYTLPANNVLWLDKGSPYGFARVALYSDLSSLVTGVGSVFGRTGSVVAQVSDYSSFYYPLSANPSGYLTAVNLSLGTVTGTNVPINNSSGAGITTLPPATASLAGIVTSGAQSFGGVKTFQNQVNVSNGTLAALNIDNTNSTAGAGGSQLQLFGSGSQAASNNKNFSIINLNGSAAGENTLSVQARNDDGSFRANLFTILQRNGEVATGSTTMVGARLFVPTGNDGFRGLVVKGFSPTQSANLQEWRNSADAPVAIVSPLGNITANSFIKQGGTSAQFLKADGSVDNTAYGSGTMMSVTPGIGFNSSTPITTAGTLNLDTVTGTSGIARKGFVIDRTAGKANVTGGNTFSNMQNFAGTIITSSGQYRGFNIQPTYNFSGTAGYTTLFISPFRTGGSGPGYLIDAGTNTASDAGGTHTPKFRVDENGRGEFSGRVSGSDPAASQDFITLGYFSAVAVQATTGSATANGSTTDFIVPISGFTVASQVFITPLTANGATGFHVTKSVGSVTIKYTTAPAAGAISWDIGYSLKGTP